MYGRVNPLQGRLAGAWEDTERAVGRCCGGLYLDRWWVLEGGCGGRGSAEAGFAKKPLASQTLLNPDRPQSTRRTAEVKAAIYSSTCWKSA